MEPSHGLHSTSILLHYQRYITVPITENFSASCLHHHLSTQVQSNARCQCAVASAPQGNVKETQTVFLTVYRREKRRLVFPSPLNVPYCSSLVPLGRGDTTPPIILLGQQQFFVISTPVSPQPNPLCPSFVDLYIFLRLPFHSSCLSEWWRSQGYWMLSISRIDTW